MAERPYTTRAKRALALADIAAARLDRPYIGTEHLLIGLLEEKTGPAAQILNELGVTIEAVNAVWHSAPGTDSMTLVSAPPNKRQCANCLLLKATDQL